MLQVTNMTFGYKENRKLFNGLSLSLEKGNIYGLLGRNGAGKTTLLKLSCGLLFPHHGQITFNGIPVENRLPKTLSDIYIIPEEFTLPDLKVPQYIKLYSPFYPAFDTSKMMDLLRELEVDATESLNKMSFGQKKKFIIAFAIASNCELVVMDEPTNGLDIPSKSKFRRIIASSIDENRCFIISTHQVRDLESLIDPVVILEDGVIVLNESIGVLSDKLSFVNTAKGEHPGGQILYRESVFGGEYLLCENHTGMSSNVDFELLFNAIQANSKQIVEFLNR